jgi:hypothetical protein
MDSDYMRQFLCQILGISVSDLTDPYRVLRLPASESRAEVIDQAAQICLSQLATMRHAVPDAEYRWMLARIAEARATVLHAAGTNPATFATPRPSMPSPYQPAPAPPAPFAPSRPTSPVPPPPPVYRPVPAQPEPALPTIVARRAVKKPSSAYATIESVVYMLGIASLLCGIAVALTWSFQKPAVAPRRPLESPPPEWRLSVSEGRGSPEEGRPLVVSDATAPTRESREVANAVQSPAGPAFSPDIADLVTLAITEARRGSFDGAEVTAKTALDRAPGLKAVKGVWAVIAYGKQYAGLADEAVDNLSTAVVVDFGREHGICGFIERDGDNYKFQSKGTTVSFTREELTGMTGPRFRLTERWLGKEKAANDLILGSIHLIKRLDATGEPALRDFDVCIEAARTRFQAALESADASQDERDFAACMLESLNEPVRSLYRGAPRATE